MEKEKIAANILGVLGLSIVATIMFMTRIAIGDARFEHWEVAAFSDALTFWTIALISGILGLVSQDERKSPYLMGVSTATALVGFVFFYSRFVTLGIAEQAGTPVTIAFGATTTLLASTILLAYTNIIKPRRATESKPV